ncbi:MAG: DEAD/DEAH box helicase [Marinirhabdus sp.]|nr:DEAD/DEAH box helicase [Marinirhabdus sp.]
MSFKNLGLSNPLLKAISEKGYTQPTPIQEKAIPRILEGKDVLASAQTGTGKTAGFTLPMLQKLSNGKQLHNRPVRALVLTPTRELAAQILEDVNTYSKYVDIKSTVIFGGVNANPQIKTLKRGVDILVATPGRLLDLHSQGVFSLKNVDFLVLDEADRMLDMGFARDLNKILAVLPSKRQNLLFSATFSKEIKKLAQNFLYQPVLVEAAAQNATADRVDQIVYKTDKSKKADLVIKLISEGDWQQVLIFTRTKHGANRLAQRLQKADISAAAIHGNKSQGARTKALASFKSGSVRVLVATDIAARGLDIPLLPHVINYELPNVPEDYVHRIGRTGRAGASGEAISIVSVDEFEYVEGIEKLLGEQLNQQVVPGFEITETLKEVLQKKADNKVANQPGRKNRGNTRNTRTSGNNKKSSSRKNRR